MNKYSILLLAAATAVACSQEGIEEVKHTPVEPVVSNLDLRASFEGEQTRISTDDGLTFTLDEGTEQIGVYVETDGVETIENLKFTAGSADAESGWVSFTPEQSIHVQATSKIYAYAPYAATNVSFNGTIEDATRAEWDGTRVVNLPAEQTQTATHEVAHLAEYYTIVATPATPAARETLDDYSVDLQFSGVFALVKFVLQNEEAEPVTVSKVVFSSDDADLAGNFALNLKHDNPSLTNTDYAPQPVEGKTASSVSVSLTTPVELKNGDQAEVYAVVNAGEFATATIEVYAELNGKEVVYTKQLTSKTITRQQRAAFGVKLMDGVAVSKEPVYDEATKTYTITTAEELAWVAEQTNAGNGFQGQTLVVSNDIDLQNVAWTPIGTESNPFKGTFDGAGHTISNLSVDTPDEKFAGLFGNATGGTIKNLVIENANVKGESYVAAVVGNAFTTKTENITIKGDIYIEGSGQDIGALTGYSYGNITDVTVEATPGSYVKGSSYFGGVVGYLGEGKTTLTNVHSNIDVIGKYYMIGGITGFAQYGNIFIDCSCSGNISLTDGNPTSPNQWLRIGGIAGCWNNDAESYVVTLSNCTFTGTLSSRNTNGDEVSEFDFGGLVGRSYNYPGVGTLIINGEKVWPVGPSEPSYDEATKTYTVTDTDELAWVADQVNAGDDFAGKTITLAGDLDLAGQEWTPIGNGARSGVTYKGNVFKGTFDGNGRTISNLSVKNISGDNAAGLFGVVAGGTVRNIVMEVNIDATSNDLAAGCVGLLVDGGTIENVTVSGSVSGHEAAAGIVSRISIDGTVRNCHNHATITGSSYNIGGIAGAAFNTAAGKTMTIENCTNDAAISGTFAVGGIVGFSSADVKGCTNDGTVSGQYSIGGIVGEQQNAGSVVSCVNNSDIVNSASNQYGTGGIVGWIRYIGIEERYPFKEEIEVIGNTNYGSIEGSNDAGGIVGVVYHYGKINENKNYAAKLASNNFVAGIVGNVQFMISSGNNTHAGMTAEHHVYVENNYSETTLDNMTGALKDKFVYTNDASLTTISGNTPDDGAQVTTSEQAAAAINAGGKVTVAGAIDKIDLTALDPAADVELVLNAAVGEIVLGSANANPANMTITVAKDVDYPVFSVVKGCNIENLTIIGDNTSSKACAGINLINMGVTVVKNVTIDGVRFDGNAIDFGFTANPQTTQNIVIENCVATNLVKPLFNCSNNKYDGTVVGDITIRNNTASFSSSAANTINGIYLCLSNTGTILIEGNTITNAPKHGFMGDANKCEHLIIRNNTIVDPVEDGIKMDNPDNKVTIEGNTITATEFGVRVARFAADRNPNIVITGNKIDMSSAKAIAGISIAQSEAFGPATLTIKDNVKVAGNPSNGWFEINEALTVNAGSDIATPFNN